MRFGDLRRLDDLFHAGVKTAVGNVLTHRAVEEKDILADEANGGAQILNLQVADVVPVKANRPFLHVVEA